MYKRQDQCGTDSGLGGDVYEGLGGVPLVPLLGQRPEVGLVLRLGHGAGVGPVVGGADRLPAEVGRVRDQSARRVRHHPRHGQDAALDAQAEGGGLGLRLGAQRGGLRQHLPGRPAGVGPLHPTPHPGFTAQVHDARGEMGDADLQAEARGTPIAQGQCPSGAADPSAGRGLRLGQRSATDELVDHGGDGRPGQARVPGDVRPGERAVRGDCADHHREVLPTHPLLRGGRGVHAPARPADPRH